MIVGADASPKADNEESPEQKDNTVTPCKDAVDLVQNISSQIQPIQFQFTLFNIRTFTRGTNKKSGSLCWGGDAHVAIPGAGRPWICQVRIQEYYFLFHYIFLSLIPPNTHFAFCCCFSALSCWYFRRRALYNPMISFQYGNNQLRWHTVYANLGELFSHILPEDLLLWTVI